MGSTDETFAFSLKTDDWDHYVRYRPAYPESMWLAWLDYHTGPLDAIMDVGTGGGVGAASLLAVARSRGRTVSRVYLSDPNEANLAAARANFTPERFPGTEFFFHCGPAEERFPGVQPGTVDLLMACASIHWTDVDAVLAEGARALRPGGGGTFAAVVYPQPTIRGEDEALAAALAAVFERRRRFQDEETDREEAMRAIRARAYRNLSIGLDYVPFDGARWVDVRRRTANLPRDGQWPLRASTWARYGEPTSAVKKGEEKVESVDEDDWWTRKGYTCDQLKEFFQTLGYEPFVMDGRLWETDAYKDFERLVKARGGTFDLVWPVATVLARTK